MIRRGKSGLNSGSRRTKAAPNRDRCPQASPLKRFEAAPAWTATALEAEVRKRNLTNVIFKPYQARENLRNSLTVADIHIVSLDSRLEGLIVPSKFVGVIAVGRPILCLGDSAGELGQLTRESGCGIVIAEDSPATLAAAIVALAADRAEVARMGERARTLWQSRFRRSAAHAAWYEIVTKAWRGETV